MPPFWIWLMASPWYHLAFSSLGAERASSAAGDIYMQLNKERELREEEIGAKPCGFHSHGIDRLCEAQGTPLGIRKCPCCPWGQRPWALLSLGRVVVEERSVSPWTSSFGYVGVSSCHTGESLGTCPNTSSRKPHRTLNSSWYQLPLCRLQV